MRKRLATRGELERVGPSRSAPTTTSPTPFERREYVAARGRWRCQTPGAAAASLLLLGRGRSVAPGARKRLVQIPESRPRPATVPGRPLPDSRSDSSAALERLAVAQIEDPASERSARKCRRHYLRFRYDAEVISAMAGRTAALTRRATAAPVRARRSARRGVHPVKTSDLSSKISPATAAV